MNFFNLFGVVDVVIVLSVIAFAVIGWKKGFLLKIVEMASSIFGLIASILLARPFAKVLDGWFGAALGTKINTYLASLGPAFSAQLSQANVQSALEGLKLPTFMVDWIVGAINYDAIASSVLDAIAPIIKSLALVVIAFIMLFFGSMIVFVLLKVLAKMVTSIPVIKQIDKVLGVLFGLFKIAALIYILLFILGLLITIPAINNAIGPFLYTDMQLDTDKFRLSKWLYNNNILKNFINVFVTALIPG
jgi:uncharacterized membrane protein required for colicin V production